MPYSVSRTVSDETLSSIIQIESGGRPTIKARTSTATGLGQFLNKTWLDTVKVHRPDVMKGRTQAQILALRTEPRFAVEMLARFTEDNQRVVGMSCTPGDLYLAHFLGAETAQRVYAADPNADVEPLVGKSAVNANASVLKGKTAGQVRAWAARRMRESAGRGWVQKYYVGGELAEEVEEPIEADKGVRVEKTMSTSRIAQGTVVTGGLTVVGTAAQIAQYAQSTADTVSVAKGAADNVITVVQTVKPFLGLMPGTWMGIAIGCGVAALIGCVFVGWERYKKLRDQGV